MTLRRCLRALVVFVVLSMIVACSSQPKSANEPAAAQATPNPLGTWLYEEKGAFTLFVFRDAGRGGMLAVGGGHVIGAPFRYSTQPGGVVITPPKTGSGPFTIKVEGDRLSMPSSDGSTVVTLRRIREDHPTYKPYIENIDQEMQARGDKDF